MENYVGLFAHGKAQGVGRHIRIAIAVATDPATDLQNIRQVDVGVGFL